MASPLSLLCGFFFPFMMLIAGGYLIARGLRRSKPAVAVRGRMSSSSAFESHISKTKCVYSRVVVEQYRRGHNPWETIFTSERREPFTISGRKIDPAHADMRTSAPSSFTGYMRPGRGLVQELAANVRQVRGIVDITSEVAPNEYLDDQVVVALLAVPGARDRLRKYSGKALRITEYIISASTNVSVFVDPAGPSGADGVIRGSTEFPLIITDSPVSKASAVMGEKSLLSIALGSLLIMAAIGLSLFLAFS